MVQNYQKMVTWLLIKCSSDWQIKIWSLFLIDSSEWRQGKESNTIQCVIPCLLSMMKTVLWSMAVFLLKIYTTSDLWLFGCSFYYQDNDSKYSSNLSRSWKEKRKSKSVMHHGTAELPSSDWNLISLNKFIVAKE